QVGTYQIYATKDQKGYEDISWIFFYLSPPWTVEVTVKPHLVSKGIVVRMFSKKAKLKGSLVDAETSQPIKDATLFLCRKHRISSISLTFTTIVSLTDLDDLFVSKGRLHDDSALDLCGHRNFPAQGREIPQAFDRAR